MLRNFQLLLPATARSFSSAGRRGVVTTTKLHDIHKRSDTVNTTTATATSTNINNRYIHPLSQLVLEYLQSEECHQWVERHGLDRGLQLEPDGTFIIKFPSYDQDMARIWTSFDNEEKKHWLTVHKGELVGRFMLQDNLKPAWNDAKSTPDKIRLAVDAMIEKINQEAIASSSSSSHTAKPE